MRSEGIPPDQDPVNLQCEWGSTERCTAICWRVGVACPPWDLPPEGASPIELEEWLSS